MFAITDTGSKRRKGGRGGRGGGRGKKRAGSSISGERHVAAKKPVEQAGVDTSRGRRTSGRDRAAPVAFWTLDGLSR